MAEAGISLEQITGQVAEDHLQAWQGVLLHPAVLADLQALQASASAAGFELSIASGFRSFDRQLRIWNEKASGKRPVLDAAGEPVALYKMSEDEQLFALLRWSALPGASRHHWGSDLDIFDSAAVSEDYRVQLVEQEVAGQGPFAPMHDWLDEQIQQDCSHGFYRPYCIPRAAAELGICAERWHISHRPTSEQFERALDRSQLLQFYRQDSSIMLGDAIVRNFDTLYQHYIQC